MCTTDKPSTPQPGWDPGQPEWDSGLLGTWSLRSIRELNTDGTLLAEPYGRQPAGRLHYGPAHQVAVVIPGHADAPAVAYIGDYEAETAGLLRHIVRVGLPPFTEDQVRWARLDGDFLVLSTDRDGRRRTELRWARA
ncbi:lipocalin-like domain-containing protein [Streptomyces yokosukanensis]|uniref:lipocalin-like domain-containing protein n=1 Tax=Streptomyces yokosukanensis TaxID=67386 RepID=UPI0034393048